MDNTTCHTWVNTSGKVDTQLHITEQARWLKKVTPSLGSFSDVINSDWFGSWGPRFHSALQTLGMILLIITIVVSLVHRLCLL